MIELKNLSKKYSQNVVLKDINLSIKPAEFVLLLGKSGSGKSTLLNMLGLIDIPTSGKYLFNGKEIFAKDAHAASAHRAQNFGFIFQRYNLIPTLSVRENILLAAKYARNDAHNCDELLELLGIDEFANQSAALLSGGQQQRVAVARALINDAPFLLADEPTGALDSANSSALMNLLTLQNQRGRGIIMVTHDESLCAHASRVIYLKDGQIISDERRTLTTPKSCAATAVAVAATSAAVATASTPKSPPQNRHSSFALLSSMLKDAFKNLSAHKLRSLLTALGIIIASAAIIATVALGEGAKASVLEDISFLSSNIIVVQKGREIGDSDSAQLADLTTGDMKLLKTLPSVREVSMLAAMPSVQISAENKELDISVYGVLDNYLAIKNKRVLAGRFFKDFEQLKNVVVLSHSAASAIFGSAQNAIGKRVKIASQSLNVIGVLEKDRKDEERFGLEAYIPASTMSANFSGDYEIVSLYVLIDANAASEQLAQTIKRTLELKRGANSIITYDLNSIRKMITSTTEKLAALVLAIAAIAMLVGGIGVMNIMLVAIKERTKEIGIKLAIGASPAIISAGFLLESLLLSLLGASIGALLASALGLALEHTSIKLVFSLKAYLLGIGLSAACGLIFGYFPARKSAKMLPAECLSEL